MDKIIDLEDSQEHDIWLKQFSRTKAGKIFNLLYEFQEIQSRNKVLGNRSVDGVSFLCNALMIVSKNTLYESDCKQLIESVYPEYFEEENKEDIACGGSSE